MAGKLSIVGIGPGEEGYIYPIARKIIEECDVLIGGKRNLELFSGLLKETMAIGNNLAEVCSYIIENIETKNMVVLATGDPGIYSIAEYLKGNLQCIDFNVLPGISSLQYLCAKLKLSWQDIHITSLHGRQVEDLPRVIKNNPKIVVFAGGKSTPDRICSDLVQKGVRDIRVSVGENLTYANERIVSGTPEEIGQMRFDSLSIMVIEHDQSESRVAAGIWEYQTPGLPDELFIRGDVPMTKEEVRAVSLSKLRLREDSVVYDIGAGTGSVSIECGLLCRSGKVFAIEKEDDAVELIKRNCTKFDLGNVEVVHGKAPDALVGLEVPDRVFVGGSAGKMEQLIQWVTDNCGSVRVVLNTVTIESTYEALQALEDFKFENIEIVSVAVSRGRAVGGKHLMQALNPVYVISADR